MKVFGISGSPRAGGTDYAINYALGLLNERGCETRYFSVRGKEIKFCIHCDYCMKNKVGCVHKDALIEYYENMVWADGIIFGTPCYQGTLSGQTKTIMDRCRAILAKDPLVLKGKTGMGLAIGGDRNGGQEIALQMIHNFFIINEMTPVGGGSFGANLGGTLWSHDHGREGISADEDGLKTVRKTTKRFYDLMIKMRLQVQGGGSDS
ncbi:MAG TPA: flavodoxin family protein [Methanocella sp.]|nr:flavodoxin family protein [Methanocella sp.]